jgi:DNA-binding transcriptional regulator YdaS (Cro superfamily)
MPKLEPVNPYVILRSREHAMGRHALTKLLGVTPAYLSDMIRERRPISEPVLAKLGLTRVVVRTASS